MAGAACARMWPISCAGSRRGAGWKAGTCRGGAPGVTPAISAAIVSAIASRTGEWVTDPDFGYQVAAAIPGVDDPELLQPRLLYQRQQRLTEYNDIVATLHRERREHLAGYRDLQPEIAGVV